MSRQERLYSDILADEAKRMKKIRPKGENKENMTKKRKMERGETRRMCKEERRRMRIEEE